MLLYLLLPIAFLLPLQASEVCPTTEFGTELTCAYKCCESSHGPKVGYYCCGDENSVILGNPEEDQTKIRAERFVAYSNGFQIDYTMLILGLIISIIISILLSLLCCLLCNGCWLHRRRNPHMYESVHDNGWYPLCCGFGIPMGTIVLSNNPPQFHHSEGTYVTSDSSTSSRGRVRFNEDGTPRGVLKNNGHGYS
ncbi:unnamed protein product [Bursaphelenchus okinawaensis]|uniref:Uncharacterized protein n=1 Tax=Bursaphelenchus okinawaensis TaxID=465554 RepID=A0A811LAA5_9BILA|nr:unnamed protein product [Bursaphelenchus okinawaensis]CAG9119586.1 unnamed protein product [Bursaphelenchus okinawaensis]